MRLVIKCLWLALLLTAACRAKVPPPTLEIVSSDAMQDTQDKVEQGDVTTGIAAMQEQLVALTNAINNNQPSSQSQQQVSAQQMTATIATLSRLLAILEKKDTNNDHAAEITELQAQIDALQTAQGQQTSQTSTDTQTPNNQPPDNTQQQGDGDPTTVNNEPDKEEQPEEQQASELAAGTYLYLDSVEGLKAVEIENVPTTNKHDSHHEVEIRENVKDGMGKTIKITGYGDSSSFPDTVAIHFDGNEYINIIMAKVLALEIAIPEKLTPSKVLNLYDENNAKGAP